MKLKNLIEGASKLGIKLNSRQLEQFQIYYEELVEWNKKCNLTSIVDYAEVQVRHFLDSLSVTLALTKEELEKPDFNIVDIGTGAGFPGVPLKIILSGPGLVLIESVGKKTAFLQYIVAKLELNNVEVIHGRAEEVARTSLYREQFYLAVSRAVASLPTLVELALPFCRIGGKFVAPKKGEVSAEIDKANKAVLTLGGRLGSVKRVELEQVRDERYLIVFDKISPTSEKYPRKPGLARRRPIQNDGGSSPPRSSSGEEIKRETLVPLTPYLARERR